MKPCEEWTKLAETERKQAEHDAFWDAYFAKETEAYKTILTEGTGNLAGKEAELAEKFDMTTTEFAGFIDGVNTSLKKEVDLDKLKEDTALELEVDFKKLFYNMHKAKAHWLYSLKEWEPVLGEEKRREIAKAYRTRGIYVRKDARIGRNEPCPCGSGKKYKNCCGKNA